jgi:hypothetical protein
MSTEISTIEIWLLPMFQGALIFGVFIALGHLHRVKLNRDHDNYTAFLTKITEHNWRVIEHPVRRYVIEIFLGLNIPPPSEMPDDRELYWATRSVHHSLINLLEHVWVLAGEPKSLAGRFSNFERLAERLISHLRGTTKMPCPEPYKRAATDMWRELHTHTRAPTKFVEWLASRPEPTNPRISL